MSLNIIIEVIGIILLIILTLIISGVIFRRHTVESPSAEVMENITRLLEIIRDRLPEKVQSEIPATANADLETKEMESAAAPEDSKEITQDDAQISIADQLWAEMNPELSIPEPEPVKVDRKNGRKEHNK